MATAEALCGCGGAHLAKAGRLVRLHVLVARGFDIEVELLFMADGQCTGRGSRQHPREGTGLAGRSTGRPAAATAEGASYAVATDGCTYGGGRRQAAAVGAR